jgi:hypothetical protein
MNDITPLRTCIRAECDDETDRVEISEFIVPAMQLLADSLDIPVTVTADISTGGGRLSIGDTIPCLHRHNVHEGTLQTHDVWCYAAQLITREVAEHIWNYWYPDRVEYARDARFSTLLEQAFREAVTFGYRLTRFRDALIGLSPQSSVAEWHDSIEAIFGSADSAQLRLFVSPETYTEVIDGPLPQVATRWKELTDFLADGLWAELGIVFPPLQAAVDETLEAGWYRCEWNDVRLWGRKGIRTTELLVNDTVEHLTSIGYGGAVEADNPATRQRAAIVPTAKKEDLEARGLTTWDLPGYLILTVAAAIRELPGAFVNVPFTEYCLLMLERSYPELVAAVEARHSKVKLTRILRGLVTGGIPVNDLHTILTTLVVRQRVIKVDKSPPPIFDPLTGVYASAAASRLEDLSIDEYVEHSRCALRRAIGSKFSRNTGTLVVYLLDPGFEKQITISVDVSKADRQALIEGIRLEAIRLPPTAQMPVLLVSGGARSRVQQMLFPEYRRTSVLSYGDLDPEMNIQPVARISPFPA